MPTPLNWITDRLPTEADGDKDGDVIRLLPDGLTWCMTCWDDIEPNQPWLAFKPADAAKFLNDVAAAVAASAPQPRRIVSITRTVYGTTHTIDAVADDGTAWWKVPGEAQWTQLPALPEREADQAAGVVP